MVAKMGALVDGLAAVHTATRLFGRQQAVEVIGFTEAVYLVTTDAGVFGTSFDAVELMPADFDLNALWRVCVEALIEQPHDDAFMDLEISGGVFDRREVDAVDAAWLAIVSFAYVIKTAVELGLV